MSISGLNSLGTTGLSQEFQSIIGNARGRQQNSNEFAKSIMEKDDANEDGLLSLEETPLDEEKFNTIDEDGDGFISEEELGSDFQNHMNEMMGRLTLKMQGIDTGEMAQSFIEKGDTDGDGMLSMAEMRLDEDKFSSLDADGDGFVTAEEVSADIEEHMAEAGEGMGAAPPPPPPSEGMSSSSTSGSSESQDEEYDEYDLNEDGQVTFDELLQAFKQGDANLDGLFNNMDTESISGMTQRIAMQAYAAQSA